LGYKAVKGCRNGESGRSEFLGSEKMRKLTMISATALAMSIATPSFAQDAEAVEEEGADDAYFEEEIIVTATKRETTLQDTPVAVSVASAEKLEQAGVRDLTNIGGLIPSLRVSQLQSSANTNFIIRGFGNGANNAGIEPSVAVFIDGVYRSRVGAALADLPELKRVEVLRGPQSTLFGKNASVGVISIVTQEPKFEFGGSAELSYGNFNAIIAKANVTGPIGEKMAFMIGGGINKRDGYGDVINLPGVKMGERDRWWTRGQLVIEPSDTVKFRIIGDYDSADENCCVVTNVVDGPTGNIVRALGGRINSNNPFNYDTYLNFPSTNKLVNYGASLQGDVELGNLALTSITAYRKNDTVQNQDSDFTSADLLGRNFQDRNIKTFTQEVRLTSDFEGPLNFLLGGFYMNEKIKQFNEIFYGVNFRNYADQLIRSLSGNALNGPSLEAGTGGPAGSYWLAGQGLTENYNLKNQSFSFFATADFEITDRLTLTGGINYTDDKKQSAINIISTDRFSGVDLFGPSAAGLRQTLLFQGGLAQQVGTALGLGRSATAAEIGAFAVAQNATYNAIVAGTSAFAAANVNNPAVNPLRGLTALQFLPPFLNIPNAVESGKTHDNDISYSVRLSYKATDSINLYASYATGFKASSINLSRDSRPFPTDFIPGSPSNVPPPAASPIRTAGLAVTNLSTGTRFAGPEDAEVKEFGIKAKWRQAAFNLTFFDQKVKGFQDNAFTGTGFVLTNAGVQKTRGIEFDGLVRPTPELTFTASFSYLDATYGSFVGCQINGAAGNCTGLAVPNVSEFSTTFGFNYNKEFDNGSALILNSNLSLDAPVNISLNVPGYKREVANLDSSLTFKMSNGIEASVWGKNLLGSDYLYANFRGVAQAGTISGYPSEPSTYGATLRYRF
jgi:iron complex outermembrane recepter protein